MTETGRRGGRGVSTTLSVGAEPVTSGALKRAAPSYAGNATKSHNVGSSTGTVGAGASGACSSTTVAIGISDATLTDDR